MPSSVAGIYLQCVEQGFLLFLVALNEYFINRFFVFVHADDGNRKYRAGTYILLILFVFIKKVLINCFSVEY